MSSVRPSTRIYNDSFGGFSKFKHVIEPRFRYPLHHRRQRSESRDPLRHRRLADQLDRPKLGGVLADAALIGREAGPNGSSREVASFSLTPSVSLGQQFTSATTGGFVRIDRAATRQVHAASLPDCT